MPFTNTTAAAYGLLAMHAMDMYRAQLHSLTPAPAAGLTAAGWQVVAYVTGTDTVLRRGVAGPMQLAGTATCYGFAARDAAGELAVVIRGTDGFVEWIEDAEFVRIPYRPATALPAGTPTITVEQGFWGVLRESAADRPDRGRARRPRSGGRRIGWRDRPGDCCRAQPRFGVGHVSDPRSGPHGA